MKTTKLIFAAAAIGLTGLLASSAHAGIHFGITFGLPLPTRVIVAPHHAPHPAPVVVTPIATAPITAPVIVKTPVVAVATTPSPGVGYVWVPGYWSVQGYHRIWVPGKWHHRPVHAHIIAHRHSHDWHHR